MTAIAGYSGPAGAAIASDSQATLDDQPLNIGSKVIKGKTFLVGIAGFAVTLDAVLKNIDTWTGPLRIKVDIGKFAEWIKEQNIAIGIPPSEADGFGFVLVTKDNSWSGSGSRLVLPGRNGMSVCGSGGVHAMTAMKLMCKKSIPRDVREFVHSAVDAAIEQSITCGGDIYVESL